MVAIGFALEAADISTLATEPVLVYAQQSHLREGLARALCRSDVRTVGTLFDVLARSADTSFGTVLLAVQRFDSGLTRGDQLVATVRALRAREPRPSVVLVVNVLLQPDRACEVLRAGADAVLCWHPLPTAGLPVGAPREPVPDLTTTGLTTRQRQLLRELCDGYNTSDIAAKQGVSVNTVRTNLRKLYNSLGVRNRPQAITWAFRHG